MKQKFKKIMAIGLVILLVFSMQAVLLGCGGLGREEIKPINKNKTQLYVGIWDGGYNSNWCETWAREFEEANKDVSFENGKKGCEIRVEKSKVYAEDGMAVKLLDAPHDIIFCEQANYYEFIRNDTVYDITEWVTTPLTEYSESKSIVNKLNAVDEIYYNALEEGKQYFGMPWYEAFASINYDIDLFEDCDFYFAADGKGDKDGFVNNLTTEKSKGPDGKAKTADDGLPATYDEFFKMCDRMVESGVVPFVWGGGVQEYINLLVTAFCIDIMGYEDAKVNYSFDGTVSKIVKNIENGIITYENLTTINNSNGYLMKSHSAYYLALKFFHRLLTTKNKEGLAKYFDENICYSQSASHTGAQTKYLQSKYSKTSSPIAMLVDGTWWYNEATIVFKQLATNPGAGQYERKIGMMPFPKPDLSYVGQENTYVSTWSTSVLVRKNIAENVKTLARAFYRYIHTDKALSSFTVEANGIRPFEYELTEGTENKMSYYAKEQYNAYKYGKVVNPYSKNNIMRSFQNSIYGRTSTWQSTCGKNSYSLVATAFGKEGVSVEDYFKGLKKYLQEKWAGFIS